MLPTTATVTGRCAWCNADLADPDGQPRWEVYAGTLPGTPRRRWPGEFVLVCYETCQPRRISARLPQRRIQQRTYGGTYRPVETVTVAGEVL